MSEAFVVTRNHRLCLPVKKEYKSRVPGSVIDSSSTGATVFIEPETVARLQDQREILLVEEDCEERKILYSLMDMIASQEPSIKGNLETLGKAGLHHLQKASSAHRWRQGNLPSTPKGVSA